MNAIVTDLLQSMDSKPNLLPAKIYPETMRWIKREKNRLWEAAGGVGNPPTVAGLIQTAVQEAVRAREGEMAHGKTPKRPDLLIPPSVIPVVEVVLELYSKKGTPEEETLKATLQLLAARRQADIKSGSTKKKNAS